MARSAGPSFIHRARVSGRCLAPYPSCRAGGDFFGGGSRLNGEAVTAAGFFSPFGFFASRPLRF
jgi:hypothetical protein